MPAVTKRAAARRDLIEHFIYLAENANLDIADRFLTNAEASFNDLAQQPLMGAPLILRHPDLSGLRK
jgi:toxin ParE1/3/4